MAKDPAFLFYFRDFLVSTDDMTNEEVGAYLRCLCVQADRGTISEHHMKKICYSHEVHSRIKTKFKSDHGGELFNNRLREEMEKRKAYSESRRNNRLKFKELNDFKKKDMNNTSESYVQHMGNGNGNGIENEIGEGKGMQGEGKPGIREVELNDAWNHFRTTYPNTEGIDRCRNEFYHRLVGGPIPGDLVKARVEAYARMKSGTEPRYIKRPMNFLTDGLLSEDWEAEEKKAVAGPKVAQVATSGGQTGEPTAEAKKAALKAATAKTWAKMQEEKSNQNGKSQTNS